MAVPRVISEIFNVEKIMTWKSGSEVTEGLKVIGSDTHRSATYDFLLTFHSNHGPISHRFRDRRRIQSKISNFPTAVYFTPQLSGFHLGIGYRREGSKKTRMTGVVAPSKTCGHARSSRRRWWAYETSTSLTVHKPSVFCCIHARQGRPRRRFHSGLLSLCRSVTGSSAHGQAKRRVGSCRFLGVGVHGQ